MTAATAELNAAIERIFAGLAWITSFAMCVYSMLFVGGEKAVMWWVLMVLSARVFDTEMRKRKPL